MATFDPTRGPRASTAQMQSSLSPPLRGGNRRRGASVYSGDRSRDSVIQFSKRGGVTPDGALGLASRLNERRGSTALVVFRRFRVLFALVCEAVFNLSLALSEARDLLILSVTRTLLHRSEHVAPRWMIRAISHAVRGCVKLPVMMRPRGVGCVAQAIMIRPRGVGCVRVTRTMMSGHVRQSVASVATPVVARMTAAVPIAP
jgi:hypothetical protein